MKNGPSPSRPRKGSRSLPPAVKCGAFLSRRTAPSPILCVKDPVQELEMPRPNNPPLAHTLISDMCSLLRHGLPPAPFPTVPQSLKLNFLPARLRYYRLKTSPHEVNGDGLPSSRGSFRGFIAPLHPSSQLRSNTSTSTVFSEDSSLNLLSPLVLSHPYSFLELYI